MKLHGRYFSGGFFVQILYLTNYKCISMVELHREMTGGQPTVALAYNRIFRYRKFHSVYFEITLNMCSSEWSHKKYD